MTELSDQIRAYYDTTTTPVDVDAIRHGQPAPNIRLLPTDGQLMEDDMRAPDHHRAPSRTRVVAAVAAAVAVIALVAGLIIASTRADDDPVPADEPKPTTPVEPEESQGEPAVELTPEEQAAIDVAERYFAAFADGDADTVLALSVPASLTPSPDSEAGVVAWWSIASRPGAESAGWPTGTCRITSGAPGQQMRVDCPTAVSDPVAIATEVDQLEWGVFVTDDGQVERLSEPLAGFKNYQPVWSAYANYLEAARPADYADVCDPAAYEAGTINSSHGIAITAPCAELLADVSDDVAAWIDRGRPELTAPGEQT